MTTALVSRSRRRRWLYRLGHTLAIVTQLVFMLAPIAESREERAMDAHVESPRTTPHPGHRPDSCPACVLLSMHGRTEERSAIPETVRSESAVQVAFVTHPLGVEREPSNTSRAPPISV